MFEEAQLYAPVTRGDDGGVTVHLGTTTPARSTRSTAPGATPWPRWPWSGSPAPRRRPPPYTEDEHEVWRIVCAELHGLHERLACATYLEGKQRLGLPEARIPQLTEVNELLGPLTGFSYVPAAGLVELAQFYGSLADGIFHSTQYVRHHSVPLYTPEPDVLHEVFGHGNCLAHDRFAALYRAAGDAVRRVRDRGRAGVHLQGVLVLPGVRGGPRGAARSAATAPGCSPRTGRSSRSPRPTCGRWTSPGWACRPTTSPTTSRSCSAPRASARSRTWSARFFTEVDDDLVQRLLHDASAPA